MFHQIPLLHDFINSYSNRFLTKFLYLTRSHSNVKYQTLVTIQYTTRSVQSMMNKNQRKAHKYRLVVSLNTRRVGKRSNCRRLRHPSGTDQYS